MLKQLYIKNYAIIEEVNIEFGDKLNMITGETGAGKSILLGALSLIAGKRANVAALQNKDSKCIVEATFDISNHNLAHFFETNELDFDPKNTVIRREIAASGKSRSFINDTPISLDKLKGLSTQLIDIHSQHDNVLLNKPDVQLRFIDTFAETHKEIELYQKAYSNLKSIEKQITDLETFNKNNTIDVDYLSFQLTEIEQIDPKGNELDTLEKDLAVMDNGEAIKSALGYFSTSIFGEDDGVLNILKIGKAKLEEVNDYIPEEICNRLNEIIIELEDLGNESELEASKLNVDFEQKIQLEQRVDAINSLLHKHRISSDLELLEVKNKLQDKLFKATNTENELEGLKKKKVEAFEKAIQAGKKLSDKRKKSFTPIEKLILPNLAKLNMKDASIKIESKTTEPFALGIDNIEIKLRTNKGGNFESIAKTASGGEISRIMFTLKSIIAEKMNLPTVIFDEIDTGVSGETADMLGQMLYDLSKNNQVVVITHLPQIASKPSVHFEVSKHSNKHKTITTVSKLSKNDRINAVAKMLSGSEITNEAISNAKQLITRF